MTKAQQKQQLRNAIHTAASTISEAERSRSSAAICAHLKAMQEYQDAETVFCFVGTGTEIRTDPLLSDALKQGKRLCVPLCTDEQRMELRQIFSLGELLPGQYGIPEPPRSAPAISVDDVDFAVIPCMTCSRAGARLGHGGGYYDRFLSTYRSAAVVVCPEKLLREELPVEPHDIPIHWVVSERGLYEDGIPAKIE